MNNKLKYLSLLLSIFVVFAISFIWFQSILNSKVSVPDKTFITLKYGTSSDKIIDIFNDYGFFKPKWFFKYYLRFEYKNRKSFIAAGTYQLPNGITNRELLNKLFTKELLFRNKLTIPEGSNIFEVARSFNQRLKIDSTIIIDLLRNKDFCLENGIETTSLEGYLMPETYFFEDNQTPEIILKFLVHNQKEALKSIMSTNKTTLSEYQILILASIIQAETGIIEEMPLVSSVYHNRLKLGMPLQADPTLLYPIFPRKIIFKSDLKQNNRYNTYKIKGLPPTPINSPSKEAIYAAANPAKTNYLYFVAKSDTTLSHNFATNYSEHLRNVNIFRKKRK